MKHSQTFLRILSNRRILLLCLIIAFLLLLVYYNYSEERHPFPMPPVIRSELSESSQEEYDLPDESYVKWIVITTINYPTEQVKKLAGMSGWRLLVVADKKTPEDWTYPNVTFLDTKTQLKLGYKVNKYLPWNSYTRKVIGYLYAIQHGAQYIYDTDDDNAPDNVLSFETDFVLEAETSGLVPSTKSSLVVNPYAHFGQETVWPRGYPLDTVMMKHNHTYKVCEMKTPIIQQGIVNGDPDVDAIFRLSRKSIDSSLNIQFDNHAPPIVLPQSLFSPFNSQNTLFHYDAFWALLLPITVAFRVTDIWRGYWAQPLLWKMGGSLGFFPPHTTQIRNAHTYLRDFDNENQLYIQSGKLVDLLTKWSCEGTDFYKCMIDLSSQMASAGMWSMHELFYIRAWIEDLQAIEYVEPQLWNDHQNEICSDVNSNLVLFYGVDKNKINQPHEKYRIPLIEFCSFPLSQTKNVTNSEREHSNQSSQAAITNNSDEQLPLPPPNVFNSTLLVVTFNFPHYENIWLLDSIYRPHFPNILYCGSLKNGSHLNDLVESSYFKDALVSEFSFINADVLSGYLCYECILKAIQMKYSVESYLVLSDDMLLNFWNNWKFPSDAIWLLGRMDHFLNTEMPSYSHWTWWKSKYGNNATKCALDTITKESLTNPIFREFLSNKETFGLNSTTVLYSESDIIYLPASKQEIFLEVGNVFKKCEVFLEIAVPTIVSGIIGVDKVVTLPGFGFFGNDRVHPLSLFNSSSSVMHPIKLSEVIKNETVRNEYCNKYIRNVLNSK